MPKDTNREEHTPVETRYPWTTPPEEMGDALPENPTDRDFAKHYGTALTLYQQQRRETIRQRQETIDVLKDIRQHMENGYPMPTWAKVHTAALVVLVFSVMYLFYAITKVTHEVRANHPGTSTVMVGELRGTLDGRLT